MATAMASARPMMLMVAGFGDDATMFESLLNTPLASHFTLIPINLPGFGAPALETDTSLRALGDWLADTARNKGAKLIMAHSIASVIASIAASRGGIDCIISLEGNLTGADAYFSGTAARYPNPTTFLQSFMPKLERKAQGDKIMARYARVVAQANPLALWQLGCDAADFSSRYVPGDWLMAHARAIYCYNPENCAEVSMDWLHDSAMERVYLPDASHWPTLDAPDLLSRELLAVLS